MKFFTVEKNIIVIFIVVFVISTKVIDNLTVKAIRPLFFTDAALLVITDTALLV